MSRGGQALGQAGEQAVVVGFLGPFDAFPVAQQFLATVHLEVVEHVGMAADHLGRGRFQGRGQGEGAAPGRERGHEQQQEHDVAQLLGRARRVAGADAVHQFEGFLDDVVAQGLGGLGLVPGAALGREQGVEDRLEMGQGGGRRRAGDHSWRFPESAAGVALGAAALASSSVLGTAAWAGWAAFFGLRPGGFRLPRFWGGFGRFGLGRVFGFGPGQLGQFLAGFGFGRFGSLFLGFGLFALRLGLGRFGGFFFPVRLWPVRFSFFPGPVCRRISCPRRGAGDRAGFFCRRRAVFRGCRTGCTGRAGC